MDTESLTQKNWPWLSVYAGLQAIILVWSSFGPPVTIDTLKLAGFAEWEKVALAAVFGILAVILNRLLFSWLKDVLVFWRIRNPLPSSRFVRLMERDPRISPKKLQANIRRKLSYHLPPAEQTLIWYGLYQKHEASPSVRANHREFLLLRDIACLTLVFGLAGMVLAIFFVSRSLQVVRYSVVLAALFMVARYAAANAAERFVLTVLACESAEKKAKVKGDTESE